MSWTLLLLLAFDTSTPPNPSPGISWDTAAVARCFVERNVTGCMAIYDLKNDRWYRYNPERCAAGFLPASTFKIFNSLVGLETGVIRDANHLRRWDGIVRPVDTWNRDHTMRSAIQYSVVWYFQGVARDIGEERMSSYLRKVGYGNGDISAGIDTFWLTGKFAISADQQVEFLAQLAEGRLPFSPRSMDIVRSVLVLDSTAKVVLRAKTGMTQLSPDTLIGWWVGEVETADADCVFAANIQGDVSTNGFQPLCREIAAEVLRGAGFTLK